MNETKKRRNRRTLKKRVRRIISLCIFLTILLFGGINIILAAQFFSFQAKATSDLMCKKISGEMNSKYFMESMGIKGLEEFNPETTNAREWINGLKNIEKGPSFLEIDQSSKDKVLSDRFAKIRIIINEKVVYLSEGFNNNVPEKIMAHQKDKDRESFIEAVNAYLSHVETSNKIYDSNGGSIGEITVAISSDYIVMALILEFTAIILMGLISLIIANIISKILTIPVTTPLEQLNEKILAIAHEDFEVGIEKQVEIKKPLREIEALAESTNIIMNKMKEFSHLLKEQKETLICQNEELEAQNDELTNSREQIEAQKNELEAQNIELSESKKKIEETQTLLLQSERMASVGQLTAAITHEINTPLGAIMSNVQISDMLAKTLSDNEIIISDAEIKEIVDQINQANSVCIMGCNRVTEIIKSLKTFSKLDQAQFQEANIMDNLKSVLVLTSNLWKNKITIHEEYGDLPKVKCFPGLLNQVFMNIITNAIQAIEGQGAIFIKTYIENNSACISIRDTGMGIKEEHVDKIFESGFTTKSSGIGMGVGLKISQNIIKKHQGDITVQSEVGKGTEFIVWVPLTDSFQNT